jgi:hypothetical protein
MSPIDPSQWKLPRLSINREGEWLHEGEEITHPGILANLRSNLRHDKAGYFVQTGPVRIPVEVADTPFVVTRVEPEGHTLRLTLNDGTQEPLNPTTLRFAPGEIPYCRVKAGQWEARLSRAAAYQLAQLLEYDEGTDEAILRVGGAAHRLRRE